ncbi:hypothetical protein crov280 [Cafeteria roenbergensis virus]|uniref:Uncharacterized protein n=1 Tax=Cafeteria roenbergensis virus (strain BV-PW1) TaxID=693272 RepID=E3T550_CROVB|nr:hypothetical protein crov280 [Cafeteria roenbergensis virus BV-PW1]ADO67313.1 hypothetical protein crov280 [Cafeteria roenbergensis virus BV-PW1]
MKITTLSSIHKKYIKKYGAKKAADKFNLNLTKAKSYENKFKSDSYQGKRTLKKSNMNDDSSIFNDDEPLKEDTYQEPPQQNNGINSIGSVLGFGAEDLNGSMSAPGMNYSGTNTGMPMGGMSGLPMGGMSGLPMGGMSGVSMDGTQGITGMGGMQEPMGGMPGMGGMQEPMGGMPGMGGMPMGGMPVMGGMPMGGMPNMSMGMPGMFQGKNIDPLLVEVAAPVQNWNGNMGKIDSLPLYSNNINNLAGGGNKKIDLSKLAFF